MTLAYQGSAEVGQACDNVPCKDLYQLLSSLRPSCCSSTASADAQQQTALVAAAQAIGP